MRLQTIIILGLTLAGFALRLIYLTTSHPFFDEYTTVLAARQILQSGWPILPSGLFYEHGLLVTYLIAPFTALFINLPLDQWQPAQWGLMLSRWPSVLLGTATTPLIYMIGCRFNEQGSTVNGQRSIVNNQWPRVNFKISNPQSPIALLAAGLFAFSPEGMVWGGRARMYALATLLVLLTVVWAYRGAIQPAPARYRWRALLALLATLLTQLGALTLVPPLLVGMVAVGWFSYREARRRGNGEAVRRRDEEMEERNSSALRLSAKPPLGTPHASRLTSHTSAFTHHIPRVWFLQPSIFLEGLALALVLGLAIWVKRLGQPLGAAALGSAGSAALPTELLETVTYQTAFHFTGPDTLDFLAQQFGPPHLFWPALITVMAVVAGLLVKWQTSEGRKAKLNQTNKDRPLVSSPPRFTFGFNLFLWLIFGLIIIEMVMFLDSFRRNPRYLVMYLPLFYLIAANAILRLTFNLQRLTFNLQLITAVALLTIFTVLSLADLRIALVTPEPAYEKAFEFIHQNWQPGDALLTMNTPAAALYLAQVDGFTVQEEADQFLLNRQTAPVDRWLGAPWIGTAANFNAALNLRQRTWFVIDTIRQPVYFRGDWQALVNSQMEQVWRKDNALIYRTRPDRIPLPSQPDELVEATLGEVIELLGYSLQISNMPSLNFTSERIVNLQSPISNLRLTLFWRALQPVTTDYTVFLHVRNRDGLTVVQHDGLSLDGAYPSSRWQPGEVVIDPFNLSLPPDLPVGRYTLWAGLYQLDTLERLPVAPDTSGENAVLLGEINYQ